MDTERVLFEVPEDRLSDLQTELLQWTQFFDLHTATIAIITREIVLCHSLRPVRPDICVTPFKLFAHLSPTRSHFPVTSDMLSDFDWWLRPRDFQDVLFTCDASLHRGGATCIDECISFAFPSAIEALALHINALELFVLVMAVRI